MVSIIMPTFNRGYVIGRAIDSVLEQTYQEFELIIIDDGSTDGTEKIILKYGSPKIKYYRMKSNMGANKARNYGMHLAKGEYFAFLDSDNAWQPEYLSKRIAAFENENVDFTFGQYFVDGNLNMVLPVITDDDCASYETFVSRLVKTNLIDTNTVCMKRCCWENEGGFDENLKRLQDWEYYFRIISTNKYRYKFCKGADVKYYSMEDSITNKENLLDAMIYIFKKRIDWLRQHQMLDEAFGYLIDTVLLGQFEDYGKFIFDIASELKKDEITQVLVRNAGEKIAQRNKYQRLIMKDEKIMQLQKKWISCLQKGKSLKKYFTDNEFNEVAIYGYGVLGKSLICELSEKSAVHVSCVIDKNPNLHIEGVLMVNDVSNLAIMDLDCIVVTAVQDFEAIRKEVGNYIDTEIVALEGVIDYIQNC